MLEFEEILFVDMILRCWCLCWVSLFCLSDSVSAKTPKQNKNARILHGRPVDITDHPYQVGLLSKKSSKIICGGVIIKPRVVFTAAHCTHTRKDKPRKNLAVLAGANHIDDPDGQVVAIEKVIKHPYFSYDGLDHDFSILLLKKPIEFGKTAQKIEISEDGDQGGNIATVSGWGITESGFQPTQLRAVELKIENHSKCQNYFPGVFHPTITSNMVCVRPHRKSTYYGDSGGPLTVDGKLVGLVSFGRTIRPDHKTTVFTRVKKFKEFAEEVIPDEYKAD